MIDRLRDLKHFDRANKDLQNPWSELKKKKMFVQNRKKASSLITLRVSLNIQTDNFVYLFVLKTTNLVSFPSKSQNNRVIFWYLLKLSTSTTTKYTTGIMSDIMLHTTKKYLRAVTMCSTFNSDCCYENRFINPNGNMFCSKNLCSGKKMREQKDFYVSLQKLLRMSGLRVNVPGEQLSLWKLNQFVFSCVTEAFISWKRSVNHLGTLLAPSTVLTGCMQNRSLTVYKHGKRMVKGVTYCRNRSRAVMYVWVVSLRSRRATVKSFGCVGSLSLAKKTSREYEAKKTVPLLQKKLCQSRSAAPKSLCQKN